MGWWHDHSRSIISPLLGVVIVAVSWRAWPDGGNYWDVGSGIGTVLVAFGIEGVVNNWFREVAKPEDEP
jgi:hypothetical protein